MKCPDCGKTGSKDDNGWWYCGKGHYWSDGSEVVPYEV